MKAATCRKCLQRHPHFKKKHINIIQHPSFLQLVSCFYVFSVLFARCSSVSIIFLPPPPVFTTTWPGIRFFFRLKVPYRRTVPGSSCIWQRTLLTRSSGYSDTSPHLGKLLLTKSSELILEASFKKNKMCVDFTQARGHNHTILPHKISPSL